MDVEKWFICNETCRWFLIHVYYFTIYVFDIYLYNNKYAILIHKPP